LLEGRLTIGIGEGGGTVESGRGEFIKRKGLAEFGRYRNKESLKQGGREEV
jgi:hypothetical protein